MTHPWALPLLVGAGGFAGSAARYGLGIASQRFAFDWPVGTFAANILGCFIIGVIVTLAGRGETLTPEVRLALATGFCGGFTTMSSFMYETAEMIRASEYLHAAVYAAGTFLLSFAAFFAGVVTIRILIRIGGALWN